MMTIDDLPGTVEEIRAKSYPDIPADLVAKVIAIERDFTDSRTEAAKRIREAIQEHLEREAGQDA